MATNCGNQGVGQRKTVPPKALVETADVATGREWSKNHDINFCPGENLNLGPRDWQSI